MKFFFNSSDSSDALSAKERLISVYGQNSVEKADVIISIGGDGFLLKCLHDFKKFNSYCEISTDCGTIVLYFKSGRNLLELFFRTLCRVVRIVNQPSLERALSYPSRRLQVTRTL